MEKYSKSLPENEFQIYISSADSGIDSDHSPNSSAKLTNSAEDIEPTEEFAATPERFLPGEEASEADRIEGINKSIDWIKEELIKMKLRDRELTKMMITIRSRIAEYKTELEKRDNGYDSDTDNFSRHGKDKYNSENWNIIAKDGTFPASGVCFENNKRATWVI